MRRIIVGFIVAMACMYGTARGQENQREEQKKQGQPQAAPANQRASGQREQPRATTPGQAAGRTAASVEPSGAGHGSSDQQIAAFIFGAAHNEIELAKLVQPKLQAEQVKRFAQKMVQEHQPGCDAMRLLAGTLVSHEAAAAAHASVTEESRREGEPAAAKEARARDPGAARRGTGEARAGQPGVTTRRATSTAASAGMLDWVSVHNEFAAKCFASTKKELEDKAGAEIDKCFMGHQVAAHMKMVGELEVLQNFATGELKEKIGEEIRLATGHLQEAKQIMDQIKDQPDERVTRNPKQ